jgi:hypothetical protein
VSDRAPRPATRDRLTRQDLLRLFDLLEEELAARDTRAELYLVGGAVMCLAHGAREATRDVDAWFQPSTVVREAAARVAARVGAPRDWLNDAVKAWLGTRGEYAPFLERPHLAVFVALPEYLLALKCMAMRLGAEFQDEADVRFLLRLLDLTTAADAMAVVTRYFDPAQVPLKTRLALEELLGA